MNPLLYIAEIALYVVLFGGLPVLRKEGFSRQWVIEALITGTVGLTVALILDVPVGVVSLLIMLFLLYGVTMRARIAVDAGNFLCRRGLYPQAHALYRLALWLQPEPIARTLVLINTSVAYLRAGEVERAARVLEKVIATEPPEMGPAQRAAGRYNLAVAYRKMGRESEARPLFQQVLDLHPRSLYGVGARHALEKGV